MANIDIPPRKPIPPLGTSQEGPQKQQQIVVRLEQMRGLLDGLEIRITKLGEALEPVSVDLPPFTMDLDTVERGAMSPLAHGMDDLNIRIDRVNRYLDLLMQRLDF